MISEWFFENFPHSHTNRSGESIYDEKRDSFVFLTNLENEF